MPVIGSYIIRLYTFHNKNCRVLSQSTVTIKAKKKNKINYSSYLATYTDITENNNHKIINQITQPLYKSMQFAKVIVIIVHYTSTISIGVLRAVSLWHILISMSSEVGEERVFTYHGGLTSLSGL